MEKGGRLNILTLTILGIFVLLAIGCSSSSSSGGGDTGTGDEADGVELSGRVIDGYVKNAAVTVYRDADLTEEIGAGVTDEEGAFSLNLTVEEVPTPVYMQSRGGTDIATGLPAPTMLFVGDGDLEAFNITPITDAVARRAQNSDLDAARQYVQERFGLDFETDLYGDPLLAEAPDGLKEGLYKSLASGTQNAALPDGEYVTTLIFLEDRNLAHSAAGIEEDKHSFDNIDAVLENNTRTLLVTIDKGEITGSMPTGAGDHEISGRVVGGSMVLTLALQDAGENQVTHVAGSIGLLGSVSGNYLHNDFNYNDHGKGVFVASFTPREFVAEGVEELVKKLYAGPRNMLFRDLLGEEKYLGSARIEIDFNNDGFDAIIEDLHVDGNAMPDHLSSDGQAIETRLLYVDHEGEQVPTNLVLMRFKADNDQYEDDDYVYVIQAAGNRRGIFLATDTGNEHRATNIGESYMSKLDSLTPVPEPGEYTARFGMVHLAMLGEDRDSESDLVARRMIGDFPEPIVIDQLEDGAHRTGSVENMLLEVSGSMLAFKTSQQDGTLSEFDQVTVLELFESGALQGEQLVGGNIDGYDVADWPAAIVGFMLPAGEEAPSFSGTLNFLGRVLYAWYEEDDTPLYNTGTLIIDGGNAALNLDPPLEAEYTLAAESQGGLYHIHGLVDEGTEYQAYIDIIWPVGGPRAIFAVAESENGEVLEIGEAFLTR